MEGTGSATIKQVAQRTTIAHIIDLFFRRARVAYCVVDGGIWPKFKLNQAFMAVRITCKNKEDPMKNEGTRVVTTFSQL